MEIQCSCKNQDCYVESIYLSDGTMNINLRAGKTHPQHVMMYLDANALVELVRQARAQLMEMAK